MLTGFDWYRLSDCSIQCKEKYVVHKCKQSDDKDIYMAWPPKPKHLSGEWDRIISKHFTPEEAKQACVDHYNNLQGGSDGYKKNKKHELDAAQEPS